PSTLERIIADEINHTIERIARLLALVYPPADIVSINRSLRGHDARVRAAALHVLESMVDGPLRTRLVAVLEEHSLDRPTTLLDRAAGLRLLLTTDDPRLRAAAAWAAARAGLLRTELRQVVLGDPSRRVRAVALLAVTLRKKSVPLPHSLPSLPIRSEP